MNTKTAKSEATELLALDEITDEQAERLNYLTAVRAGAYQVARHGGSVFVSTQANPAFYEKRDYFGSVDACLTLPLPEQCIWKLFHGDDKGASAHVLFRPVGQPATDRVFGQAATLPLAMLRAWWQIQPE